jgi:hypothetical protein
MAPQQTKLHAYLLGTQVRIGHRVFEKAQHMFWKDKETERFTPTLSLIHLEEQTQQPAVELTPVVSIDTLNPDFYLWGRNCKVMKMEVEKAQDILFGAEPEPTREQQDLFWEGYMNAIVVH